MTQFGLFAIAFVIVFSLESQAASEVNYINITSDSNASCNLQPCLTLSQFAANSHSYVQNNTHLVLVFFPGKYYLNRSNLTLSNIDNLEMKSETSTAQIVCTNNTHIFLSQSQNIRIANLEFIWCGRNQVKRVQEFAVYNMIFDGQHLISGPALELIETTARIINSTFVSNSHGKVTKCVYLPLYLGLSALCPETNVGGAIVSISSKVNISLSRFEDNAAILGGAIFADQESIINMNDNVFIGNHAIRFGGVMFSCSSKFQIEASVFHNNTCRSDGAVLASCCNSNIAFEASNFTSNIATKRGGVLRSFDSNITINESEFHNNSAICGGVLHSRNDMITIEASCFHDNSAVDIYSTSFNTYIGGHGGVLSLDQSTFTAKNNRFLDNKATLGGVLESFDYKPMSSSGDKMKPLPTGVITIEKCLFDNNSAIQGGALYSDKSTMTIKASTFRNNTALIRGGAMMTIKRSNITVEASEFDNNTAAFGGALYCKRSNMTMEVSKFRNNRARIGGALNSVESSIIEVNSCDFQNNTVTKKGGGGVYYSNNSTINTNLCTFNQNSLPIFLEV